MTESVKELISSRIHQMNEGFFNLLILAGQKKTGKTGVLKQINKEFGFPMINLNMDLSQKLLNLSQRKQVIQLPVFLENSVTEQKSNVVILDNTEIIFQPSFNHDPLRLIQYVSRNHKIIFSWSGEVRDGSLIYASPDHPECKKYPIGDIQVVSMV